MLKPTESTQLLSKLLVEIVPSVWCLFWKQFLYCFSGLVWAFKTQTKASKQPEHGYLFCFFWTVEMEVCTVLKTYPKGFPLLCSFLAPGRSCAHHSPTHLSGLLNPPSSLLCTDNADYSSLRPDIWFIFCSSRSKAENTAKQAVPQYHALVTGDRKFTNLSHMGIFGILSLQGSLSIF